MHKWRQTVPLTLILVLSVVGCGEVSGEAEVKKNGESVWKFSPDSCQTGEHEDYYGVVLLEKGALVSRLKYIEPRGDDRVEIISHKLGEVTIVRGDERCETFDVVVRPGNGSTNDFAWMEGHLVLDCKLGNLEVKANVTFSGCD